MALPLCPGHLRLESFGKSHGGNFRPEDARAAGMYVLPDPSVPDGARLNRELRIAIPNSDLLDPFAIDDSAKSQLPLWPQGPMARVKSPI